MVMGSKGRLLSITVDDGRERVQHRMGRTPVGCRWGKLKVITLLFIGHGHTLQLKIEYGMHVFQF